MISRAVFNNVLVAALFGVLVPYLKGLEFLDTALLLVYALFGMFFTAPLAADAAHGAGLRLEGYFRAVVKGWLSGLAVTWLGLLTVCAKAGRAVLPPAAVLLPLALLGLAACLFTGAVAARVTAASPSAGAAKAKLRIGFLCFLVVLLGAPRLLDEDQAVALIGLLTPEGLVRLTLMVVPALAAGTVLLLAGYRARAN